MTVKEQLLTILEQSDGKALSGQELAERLGVTRQAVWKVINSLKKEGFSVEATTGKGYILKQAGDYLSAERVREYLPHSLRNLHIRVFDSLPSTNTYAKKLAADGTEETALIIAKEQTAGRGRRGHTFFSPDRGGLYMSLLLQPQKEFAHISLYTVCAANAVCAAIEELCSKRPQIKWVNDIFLGEKKICGILTEAVANMETRGVDYVIMGIGVNISTESFPEEIAEIAGSIGGGITRSRLAAGVTEKLYRELSLPSDEIIRRYRERSLVIGKEVSFERSGEHFTAVATGIGEDGALTVRLADGRVLSLNSGEISVKLSGNRV